MHILTVKGLHKSFSLYNSPLDRLKERLLGGQRHRQYSAIHDVNLALAPGESLALIGQNGAGKSTLLKLITGVLLADAGVIERRGRITGLLELGTGFDHELSGMENISVNGSLLGMNAAEIEQRRATIVEFAELGDYIHEPMRTYSSGMMMRLGFSIAIHADPACFVVDEALSVGDARFQQKCLRKIRDFQSKGGSLLFVSHDLTSVKLLCNRAIVLDQGRTVFEGTPDAAVNYYYQVIARLDQVEMVANSAKNTGYGLKNVQILSAELQNRSGKTESFSAGEQAYLNIQIIAQQAVSDLELGILIRDRFGQDVFGTNTALLGNEAALHFSAGQRAVIEVGFPMNVGIGKYTVTLALHKDMDHLEHCEHWWDNVLEFEVAGFHTPVFAGMVYLPVTLQQTGKRDIAA